MIQTYTQMYLSRWIMWLYDENFSKIRPKIYQLVQRVYLS